MNFVADNAPIAAKPQDTLILRRSASDARAGQGALAAYLLRPLGGAAVGIAIWWAATTPRWHPDAFVRAFSPAQTAHALYDLAASGAIWPHLLASLQRVAIGLAIATAIGFPLGVVIGVSRRLEQATSASFQFLRMISPISWMPLAVMTLGIGNAPVYFLLAIATVWPIVLNTAAGVHAVDRKWVQLSRSLCTTRWETIRLIVLPAILSHLTTGLRLALGTAWIILVPAEMLGVSNGLGYYILDTRDRLAYSELMAVILLIGAIGFTLDSCLRLLHWRYARGQAMSSPLW